MIIVMLVKVQVINNVIGMNKHYLVKIGQNVVNKGRPLIANIAVPVFGIKDNVNNWNVNIFMKTSVLIIWFPPNLQHGIIACYLINVKIWNQI